MAETMVRSGEHAPVCSPNVKHLCRMELGGAGQITIDFSSNVSRDACTLLL